MYPRSVGGFTRPTPSRPGIHNDALFRLFGQELDTYADVQIDVYAQAKKKWSECTIEEWKAGADGTRSLLVLNKDMNAPDV